MIACTHCIKLRSEKLFRAFVRESSGVDFVAAIVVVFTINASAATQVTLIATKNTPIFGPDSGSSGIDFTTRSNGAGYSLYVGTNGTGSARRSFLQFDFSSLPPGAVVTNATLSLALDREPNANNELLSLHRVTSPWTTGSSNSDVTGSAGQGAPATTNDATWNYASWPTVLWQNAGGDFLAEVVASTWIGPLGTNSTPLSYSWSSAGMVDSINAWIQNPSSNFGWAMTGNESQTQSVKRFISRNAVASNGLPMDASLLPNLVMTYEISSGQSTNPGNSNSGTGSSDVDNSVTPSPWGKQRRRALLSHPAGF